MRRYDKTVLQGTPCPTYRLTKHISKVCQQSARDGEEEDTRGIRLPAAKHLQAITIDPELRVFCMVKLESMDSERRSGGADDLSEKQVDTTKDPIRLGNDSDTSLPSLEQSESCTRSCSLDFDELNFQAIPWSPSSGYTDYATTPSIHSLGTEMSAKGKLDPR